MQSDNKGESLYTRTEMMLGADAVSKLSSSHVAIFGVGGVGGYAAEAVARAGVGKITLIDPDRVSISNINRQIIALHSTLGENKAEAMKKRILDINPECEVTAIPKFYSEECYSDFDFSDYTYIIDAIDSTKSKIGLITRAKGEGISIISSMGAGNKLDPTRFCVADIYQTSVDPLARVIRNACRRAKITGLKVVFSDEAPIGERDVGAPGSVSFIPSVAGLILAGEVIKDIVNM